MKTADAVWVCFVTISGREVPDFVADNRAAVMSHANTIAASTDFSLAPIRTAQYVRSDLAPADGEVIVPRWVYDLLCNYVEHDHFPRGSRQRLSDFIYSIKR